MKFFAGVICLEILPLGEVVLSVFSMQVRMRSTVENRTQALFCLKRIAPLNENFGIGNFLKSEAYITEHKCSTRWETANQLQ